MSDEMEAIGSMAEGALLARTVEGNTGSAVQTNEVVCLNCSTPLIGPYCANCGQSAHIHRSISAFWHDILHGVLHFDGKFWRTLPLLAWHPGKLTRRYIHGERANFISPMALFLFAIFMMFAIFSYVGSPDFTGNDVEAVKIINNGDPEKVSLGVVYARRLQKRADEIETELKALQAERDALSEDATPAQKVALNKKILDLKREGNSISRAQSATNKYEEIVGIEDGPTSDGNGISSGWKPFDNWIKKAMAKIKTNPDLVLYKIQSNGYKFAWLLIPLSIPFVWLVTLGVRGHRFYDHAVFTTYSIAFMSLMFIFATLAVKLGVMADAIAVIAFIYAPFHMYRQLRHAYGLSRLGTIVRLSFLIGCIVIVLLMFLTILLALGLIG